MRCWKRSTSRLGSSRGQIRHFQAVLRNTLNPLREGSPGPQRLSACVAMCTYNGASYLREQLQSVLEQSRLPDCMVILDDGSGDTTLQIARQFAREAPFPVRVERNDRNLGYAKNFEKAIRLAEGDLIFLADQDDVWDCSKLSKMVAQFERAPHVGLVFTDAEVVGEDLHPCGYRLWSTVGFSAAKQVQVQDGRAFDLLLLWGNVVTGATMGFRSSFKDLVLPVEGGIHDAWIALLISAVADVAPIPEPLIQYRQHATNQIGAKRTGLLERILRPRPLQARDLERLLEASARLERWPDAPADRLVLLSESIDHLATRLALPPQRVLRVSTICRQLLKGRYHRLSNGLSTAVKDLACGKATG